MRNLNAEYRRQFKVAQSLAYRRLTAKVSNDLPPRYLSLVTHVLNRETDKPTILELQLHNK